jgi:hypothetical protein
MAVKTINHPAMFRMKFGYSPSLKRMLFIDRKSACGNSFCFFLVPNKQRLLFTKPSPLGEGGPRSGG